jgi:hypothetical protein
MTLLPSGLIGSNRIQCSICNNPRSSYQFAASGYPTKAPCGDILVDGSLCNEERTKVYYRCSNPDCKEITVKNKKFLDSTMTEGCTHENKISLARSNIRPTSEAPTSSGTGGNVRSEIINDQVTYYHFIE